MLITVVDDITKPQSFERRDGTLLDWAIEYFGADGTERITEFYEEIALGEYKVIPKDYETLNARYANVIVKTNPAGLDPITYLWIAYAALVVASFVLIKPPKLGNQTEDSNRKQSPNNALDGQTNLARRLQRIPEIFGKVQSFPDLIADSIFRYVDQLKVQTEVFCIGRGFYQLDEFKSGDTLVSTIPEATLEIFEPWQTIPNFEKVSTSSSVVSVSLPGPNELFADNFKRQNDWELTYNSATDEGIITDVGLLTAFEFFTAGDTVEVTGLVVGGGPSALNLNGVYTLAAATANSITLQAAATVSGFWASLDLTPSFPNNDLAKVILNKQVIAGPFLAPGNNYSKILIDIEAPQGIAQGTYLNLTLSVNFEVRYQQVVDGTPTGPVYTQAFTITGDSTDALFFTYEISANIVAGNDYQVSVVRTSDALLDENTTENLKWTRLASSKFIDGSDNVGTTRARLTLVANEQSINIQDRKFNCIATRKCLSYSGSSIVGNLQTGAGLVATQKFADALLTYFIDNKLANKQSSLLDIDELYAIQSRLDSSFNGLKGQFNFTFDSDSASAQEELFTIADAARCFITKTGSFFDVGRDEAQSSPKRMINRALKKPNSERKSKKYNLSTSNDGVEFTYLDFEAGERRTIVLPDGLPTSDPLYGTLATQNPLKIQSVGITNYTQAWDRAQYEFRRVVYQRTSVKVDVGASVATLPLNSRVEYSDGTLSASIEGRSDGFVKAVNGLEIETSEECEFIVDVDHEVFLTTEQGETQGPYAVEPLAHTFGFRLLTSPSETPYVRGQSDYQRGTLYTFRAVSYQTNAMLLQRKTPTDGFYYSIELINYSDEYYSADTQTPP